MNAAAFSGFEGLLTSLGISEGLFWVLFVVLVAWTLALKGFALWHAARNYQRRWFIALLIINTFGLFELVYLIWFRKDKKANRTQSLFNMPEGASSSSA